MKKIAILQSNYIPWKGYFDMIRSVDEFILYDDMQYTRRDWRNRNLVQSPQGLHWLTIPVEAKGKFDQKIKDTMISDKKWAKDHWQTLRLYYSKAPHFKEYAELFEKTFVECGTLETLSEVNFKWIQLICGILRIPTKLSWSMDYELKEGKTERLIGLCQSAGGTAYLSGPAAKDYIVDQLFQDAGIELKYMDYSGYPEYPQLHSPFQHGVSILDLLFNTGPKALNYMKQISV
jgi:hypothetical protein